MAYNSRLLDRYVALMAQGTDGLSTSSSGSPCCGDSGMPSPDSRSSTAAAEEGVAESVAGAAPVQQRQPSDDGGETAMYRGPSNHPGGSGLVWKCRTCPYCNGSRSAVVKHAKPSPWEFWERVLKAPKHVVAPMVEASELPFRMLCREHGADLAYTPMFHSRSFAESHEYRRKEFSTCPEDRPLFVQFCGHDADTVLAAARHVEDHCDAVDINLGCPQGIARRGFYGAFLMEHWDVVHTILHTLHVELKVPVTAKMRVFDDDALTLAYAEMIRDAGAHVVAVHGRTREQKGQQTGLADLEKIRMVREHIGASVPVIENGNIVTFADIQPNLETTGCQAVMSAEALLWDPRLFSNPRRPVLTGRSFRCPKSVRLEAIDTARAYLDCVTRFPVDLGFAKGHLFKILYHSYERFPAMRHALGDFNCGDGDISFLVQHVERVRELEGAVDDESEASTESAAGGEAQNPTRRVTTEEKLAAKERLREAVVEDAESYGFALLMGDSKF